jgi:hypothetical protein
MKEPDMSVTQVFRAAAFHCTLPDSALALTSMTGEESPSRLFCYSNNVFLEGRATQYVIDFNFPANRPFVGGILGPFRF